MGLNCHYMTKPKPHRKRLEMEILLDDIHQLEKNGKITTSTALQPTLLAEAAKTRGVYHSKLLSKNHFLASKQLRENPDIIIRRADKASSLVVHGREEYLQKVDNILSDTSKFKRITRMSDVDIPETPMLPLLSSLSLT
ncbi:hypothetical protein Pcinc_003985 [Petrolisthes cinctipes]|uniref:Uncharacterized protein n=1 Tax=Petrolisthes cinctipes TaxID=88211 RepID=A0AAE1L0P8_PETCI|nr:hypothetical protein Pcinc_003985 [Petrolisthes cinctipes]